MIGICLKYIFKFRCLLRKLSTKHVNFNFKEGQVKTHSKQKTKELSTV